MWHSKIRKIVTPSRFRLNFPLRYPSERDGVVVEGGNQVQWYFGNEAVWIDTPGSFMEESGRDEWQSLVEALRRVRPERPVDGVALVVSISEALAADDLQIKAVAQRLRGRIDEMIARWGIEFPVYLLFSRTDEIPGFQRVFQRTDRLWRRPDIRRHYRTEGRGLDAAHTVRRGV